MSREVKFCAWVKEKTKDGAIREGFMITSDKVQSIDLNPYRQIELSDLGIVHIAHVGSFPEHYHLERLVFEDIELLQYIGRQDKAGKEIYEGWILKINGGTNDGRTCYVVYDEQKVAYVGKNNFLFQYLDMFDNVEFEVVGNIYQHKHLLDEGN